MARQPKPISGRPIVTDEVRKVADLKPDPRNANRHSESQVAQIVTSIEQYGYIDKIVIRPNGQLIGGEGRLDAINRIGWDEIAVRVVAGLTEAQYKALGLALNRIPRNSRFDDDVLRELLGEIQQDGENPLSLGFSPAELDKIMAEPADLEVKEIETGPVSDEFWISIRGPLAQQAEVLRKLQEVMKPYAGVTVEQGTIALA